jgi:hypothetical protein
LGAFAAFLPFSSLSASILSEMATPRHWQSESDTGASTAAMTDQNLLFSAMRFSGFEDGLVSIILSGRRP